MGPTSSQWQVRIPEQPDLQVRVLGECTVRYRGSICSGLTRKQIALTAYLALNQGRAFRRDQLAELLWPRVSIDKARHSLSQAIYALRQSQYPLAPAVDNDLLMFHQGRFSIDLLELEAAIDAEDISAIILQDSGPFMEGFGIPDSKVFDEWQEELRRDLDQRILDVAERWSSTREDAGEWGSIERLGDYLLKRSLVNEALVARHLRSLLAQGKLHSAEALLAKISPGGKNDLDLEHERLLQFEDVIRAARFLDGDQHAFIGRTAETECLRVLANRALGGVAVLAAIEGEAGVGKSRLCIQFLRYCAIKGARVLSARCHSEEETIPYGPLTRAIMESLTSSEITQLPQEWLEPLNIVLPGIGGRWHDPGGESAAHIESRSHIYEAVAQLLLRMSDGRLLVLCLDDFQWASQSAVHLTQYILRRLNDYPILLLTARRPAWRQVSNRLEVTHDVYRKIHLAPLSADETDALINDYVQRRRLILSKSSREHVIRLTGGLPLFVVELLRALGSRTPGVAQEISDIPPSLNDLVLSRLMELPPESLRTLEMAAVFGTHVRESALRLAIGSDREGFVRSVEALRDSGLLRETERRLVFSHDVIREVCYSNMSHARRRLCHHRAAHALAKVGDKDDLGLIANHCMVAEDTSRTHRYALRAAHEFVKRGGFEEAHRYFRLAAGSARNPHTRVEVERTLAEVLLGACLFRESLPLVKGLAEYYQQVSDGCGVAWAGIASTLIETKLGTISSASAISRLEALADRAGRLDNPVLVTQALRPLTLAVLNNGDPKAAERLTQRLEQRLQSTEGDEERLELIQYLVATAVVFWSASAAVHLSKQAQQLSNLSLRPRAQYNAAFAAGCGLLMSGDLKGSQREHERALAIVRNNHLWDLTSPTLNNYAVVLLELGEYEQALDMCMTGEKRARAAGVSQELAPLLINRGIALLELGRWMELCVVARDLLTFDEDASQWWCKPTSYIFSGFERLRAGDTAKAAELRDLLLPYASGKRNTNDPSYAEIYIARVAEREEKTEEAVSRLTLRIADCRSRDVFCRYRLELERARLSMTTQPLAAGETAGSIRAHAAEMGAVPLVRKADFILDRLL